MFTLIHILLCCHHLTNHRTQADILFLNDNFIITEENGSIFERRVTELDLEEFLSYGPQKDSTRFGKPLQRKSKDGRITRWNVEEDDSLCTLEEVFLQVHPRLGFNIELKFDDHVAYSDDQLTRCLNRILNVVFEHSNNRNIIFSSFQPDAALLMRKLQSVHPVYFQLMTPEMTHVTTRIAGTLGYLAPEYARGAQLTRKADIYSFGILLLEIVNGRRNIDTKLPKEDRYLHEKTWLLVESNQLANWVNSIGIEIDTQAACNFIKIGLLCTQDTARLRPSMSKVVKMLKCELEVDIQNLSRPQTVSDFMELCGTPGTTTNIGHLTDSTTLSTTVAFAEVPF